MPIHKNLSYYAGKPVIDWKPAINYGDDDEDKNSEIEYPIFEVGDTSFDVQACAPRFRLDYDEHDSDSITLAQFLAIYVKLPQAVETQALVIGNWGTERDNAVALVEALVGYRDRLPELRALFIGDITPREWDISWILQTDLSAIWPSHPKLEQIGVRGGDGLTLGRIRSTALKSLTIEAGGLRRRVILDALAAEAPNLEHLEIWTGSANYGGDSSPADFASLFADELFPKLKTLALRDCQYADAMAKAIAGSPILGRIETLDLSLGVLSDEGAEALLASPQIAGLKKLDLHHHYLSDAMMERLKALPVEVDLSDQKKADVYDDDTYRYIAISE